MINEQLNFWDIIDLVEIEKELWEEAKLLRIFNVTWDFIWIKINKVEFNIFDLENTWENEIFESEEIELWDELDNLDEEVEQVETTKEEDNNENKKVWFKVLEFEWELDKEQVSQVFTINEDYRFDEEWKLILFL